MCIYGERDQVGMQGQNNAGIHCYFPFDYFCGFQIKNVINLKYFKRHIAILYLCKGTLYAKIQVKRDPQKGKLRALAELKHWASDYKVWGVNYRSKV